MPTYQYQCSGCRYEMEEFQSITATPLKKCPKCGCEGLQRKIGGGLATLRFTGSGFYITDYGKKGEGENCGCGKKKGSCAQPVESGGE